MGESNTLVYKLPKDQILKIDMCLCAQPRQTLEQFYAQCEVKPTLLCNGGFFSMSDGATCFNYKDNDEVISSTDIALEGFGITADNKLQLGFANNPTFNDFVSGYPILIKDGKPYSSSLGSEINYKARRTVLGYNDDYVFLVAVEKPGFTFVELQNYLLGLGVTQAINLDGGGSTRILKNGELVTKEKYSRPVDNVIAFYLKPSVLYRVQAGSFLIKSNAEKLCKQIQAKGEKYSGAYVRKIGNQYKVQIGAFSVRENANRLASELKNLGFNVFITTL